MSLAARIPLCLVAAAAALAQQPARQDVFVSGRIVDWSGPVAGAHVWVRDDGLRGSATTDWNGGFAIPVSGRRTYYLFVSAFCWERKTLVVPVGQTVSFDAGTIDLGVPPICCPEGVFGLYRSPLPQSLVPTALAARPAPQRRDRAVLPPDLVSIAMSGFDWHESAECSDRHRIAFEESIRAAGLPLVSGGAPAVLIQGLGPCLSGPNNGPLIVYAKDGPRWRAVLHQTGNRLDRLPSSTQGWRDLELRQHASAFDEVRRTYQFEKTAYREAGCRVLRTGDPTTGKQLAQPVVTPCQ